MEFKYPNYSNTSEILGSKYLNEVKRLGVSAYVDNPNNGNVLAFPFDGN